MFYGYGRRPGGMGRGRGRGYGYGRGRGFGGGWRQGGFGYASFWEGQPGLENVTPEEELNMLLSYKKYLENELRMVEKRMEGLRRKLGNP